MYNDISLYNIYFDNKYLWYKAILPTHSSPKTRLGVAVNFVFEGGGADIVLSYQQGSNIC